jgi:hypothetical protein
MPQIRTENLLSPFETSHRALTFGDRRRAGETARTLLKTFNLEQAQAVYFV